MVYQIVISMFGILGAIKESQTVMWVWVGLDVVLIVCNGMLYSRISSVLMAFLTVLTVMYALVLHQRNSSEQSTNRNVVDSINPSEVTDEPPIYAVTDIGHPMTPTA